ncbi:hypothetical protein pdam_00000474 [Pocillopora damicornis]|uniref:Peptidase M24 C-terminal domain-containing protein n=1 Tax=Pocillopora damicornis TaxID=46731 RepID=A0A3M6UJ49_POCDA|nr:hypothetical protein pdam_00000474 [Pocillopora damicornis]
MLHQQNIKQASTSMMLEGFLSEMRRRSKIRGKKKVPLQSVAKEQSLPFQRKLIDVSLLSKSQVDWLNKYHERTREVIGAELRRRKREMALKWLMKETEPLK